jgi:hypothetical protein
MSCKLSITHSADAYTCGMVVLDSVSLLAIVDRIPVFRMSLYLVWLVEPVEEIAFGLSENMMEKNQPYSSRLRHGSFSVKEL